MADVVNKKAVIKELMERGKKKGIYDLGVFDTGVSEEICAYDVDRLKQFFTSCEEEKIDILRLEVKNENVENENKVK